MITKETVLYVHGMGGGADSRIPAILRDCFAGGKGPSVVVRTYSSDPETAQSQLLAWLEELKPTLIVGESLGAAHALALRYSAFKAGLLPSELPVILVSPALNAPALFYRLAFITLIPGVGAYLNRIYRPHPGDRQKMDFRFKLLKKWKAVHSNAAALDGQCGIFAFFGKHDSYRRSGIVSVCSWKKRFGSESYSVYDGSHFMEEEFVRTMLAERILEALSSKGCS